MNLIYRITQTILIWVFPVLLVLTSFVLMLPNSDQHKSAIGYGSFYEELSQTLQAPPQQDSYSTETIILRAAFEDLATPDWLRNVVETNVDNFTQWIVGDQETWQLFIPTEEVQRNVATSVDAEVEQILDDSADSIEPCNSERSQDIRRNGFNLDVEFCLPPSVISGEETLTEFMGIQDESLQDSFFNSFLEQNPFTTDAIAVDQVFPESGFVSSLNIIRSGYTWLSGNLLIIWIVFLAFVVGHLLVAKSTDKTFLVQIQRIMMLTGINTLILSLVIVLFIAGGNYISSSLVGFILPGLVLNQVQNMVLFRVVLVTIGLLQIAIGLSLLFIGIRIALTILRNMGIIGSVQERNKRLTQSTADLKKNPTLDGEFRRSIEKSKEDQHSITLDDLGGVSEPGSDYYNGYNPFTRQTTPAQEEETKFPSTPAPEQTPTAADNQSTPPPVVLPVETSTGYEDAVHSDTSSSSTDEQTSSDNLQRTPASPQTQPPAQTQQSTPTPLESTDAAQSRSNSKPKPTIIDTGSNGNKKIGL